MIASRRNFLAGFGSLLAAPAVVRADSLMHVRSIVKPYATVWGVGWDLEVVEHTVWTPNEALRFAKFDSSGIGKFREITEVVYSKPMPPLTGHSNHWTERPNLTRDWFAAQRKAIVDETTGFTNVAEFSALKDWEKERKGNIYVPQHVFLKGV